jgi:enterochelin esterase-like enzyme
LLALLLSAPVVVRGADEPKGPAPKGEIRKYTFKRSKIFPGTVRDYWIYVPTGYNPAKPACVYVGQDGIGFNAPDVFDDLIDKKEMPVVIGVFVMHGRVKAPSDQALDRYNRSYEYDGVNDNYVRFFARRIAARRGEKENFRWPSDSIIQGRQRSLHRRSQ